MLVKTVATFALAFLSAGVHATPLVNLAKRDGNNDSEPIPPSYSVSITNRLRPSLPAISIPGCK